MKYICKNSRVFFEIDVFTNSLEKTFDRVSFLTNVMDRGLQLFAKDYGRVFEFTLNACRFQLLIIVAKLSALDEAGLIM